MMRGKDVGKVLVGLEKEAIAAVTSPREVVKRIKVFSKDPALVSYFFASLIDRADRGGKDLPKELREAIDEELNGEDKEDGTGDGLPPPLDQAMKDWLAGVPAVPHPVSEVEAIRLDYETGAGD